MTASDASGIADVVEVLSKRLPGTKRLPCPVVAAFKHTGSESYRIYRVAVLRRTDVGLEALCTTVVCCAAQMPFCYSQCCCH